MLKSLDVLIGLVVIMLVLSMAVTVITQFVTTVFNSRGRHLKRGLADLIKQLEPTLPGTVAEAIAEKVLTHPLVSGATTRLASIVHREEFTSLLLQLADGDVLHALAPEHQEQLKNVLARNGIAKPGETLAKIRERTLQLEIEHPELATDVRQGMAILREGRSEFVAKIHNWFDQTMDRTSERFTFSTRGITFAGAALVALLFQADTFMIANRLGADETLRAQFVVQAGAITAPAPQPGESAPLEIDRQYMKFLQENGLIAVPSPGRAWLERLPSVNPLGLIMTAFLLSLGAPFWYKALGHLLQLRSVLAKKDDEQRTNRQNSAAAAT